VIPRTNVDEHFLLPEEKDTALLGAYTALFYAGDYPDYLNITMVRGQGDVIITSRLPTVFGKPEGKTQSVRLTIDMWDELVKMIPLADEKLKAIDYVDSTY
jgi:hypothetical protein